MEIVLKSGRFGIFAMEEGTCLPMSAEYARERFERLSCREQSDCSNLKSQLKRYKGVVWPSVRPFTERKRRDC